MTITIALRQNLLTALLLSSVAAVCPLSLRAQQSPAPKTADTTQSTPKDTSAAAKAVREAEAKIKEVEKKAKELEAEAMKKVDEAKKIAEEKLNVVKKEAEKVAQSALDVANDAIETTEKAKRTLKRLEQSIKLFEDNSRFSQTMRNASAYFNTYYNAQRLMILAEDEFAFHDAKKRVKPRVVVLNESTLAEDAADTRDVPKFLEALVISKEKLTPVAKELDSVIIKGSKILGKHARTEYIDPTLFLMAKAYFYRSEWFNAQIKCQELLENFPYSPLSPDAHLLLAKALLMQKKFSQGETVLSRAIDISWAQRRYDALSEAFRIQAELALHFNRPEDAVKPYRRAVAQADDPELRIKWQLDLGLLLYRLKQFRAAERELWNVRRFTPDALTTFEADLYRAATLSHLRQYGVSDSIFAALKANQTFDEWRAWVYAEEMNHYRISSNATNLPQVKALADTTKFGAEAVAAAYYQAGVEAFRSGDEKQAYQYFAKALHPESPSHYQAKRYVDLLDLLGLFAMTVKEAEDVRLADSLDNAAAQMAKQTQQQTAARDSSASSDSAAVPFAAAPLMNRDTIRVRLAGDFYRYGRANEILGRPDSAIQMYALAARTTPQSDSNRARYLYSVARLVGFERKAGSPPRKRADSILADIVRLYPLTQYGIDAKVRLGLTEYAVRDSVGELFASGDRFRTVGLLSKALRQFDSLAAFYPASDYAPRALYVAGWLYEQHLNNKDSAIARYQRLVERYPESQYARDIRLTLEEVFALRQREQEFRDSVRFVDSVAAAERMRTPQSGNPPEQQPPSTLDQKPAPAAATPSQPKALPPTSATPNKKRKQ
jgi:outer membrane protein assembly factor BamD (BamD/ComL family)